jgi:hypothetical protein
MAAHHGNVPDPGPLGGRDADQDAEMAGRLRAG